MPRASTVALPLLSAHAVLAARRMEAQRRNIARARKLFQQALEADPQHTQSLVGLGQLEARAGNAATALSLYRQGLQLRPRSTHLLSSLAHLHKKQRDYDAAAEAWRLLLQARSSSRCCRACLHHHLCAAHPRSHITPQQYSFQIQVEPSNGLACAGLGELAEREGNLEEAARMYAQGLACKGEMGSKLSAAKHVIVTAWAGVRGAVLAAKVLLQPVQSCLLSQP